jgi:hypothetical protein
MTRLKKSARRLNVRFRHKALKQRDVKKSKVLINRFLDLMLAINHFHPSYRRGSMMCGFILLLKTFTVLCDFTNDDERVPDRARNIASFSEEQCWNYFETRKEDLPRLQRCLRIDDVVRLPNGKVMLGEIVMLRGLYELVTGNDQFDGSVWFGPVHSIARI